MTVNLVAEELTPDGQETRVSLSRDNNPTEQAREHTTKNWETMLAGSKKVVEA